MRILLADDDPTARSILSAIFRKLGHQPETAEDGEQALQLALQEPHPEIIVLDWMMPKLSGPEVAKRIREHTKQIPFRPYILILSTKNDRKEVALALNEGADDFLSKPPDGSELVARMRVAERMVAHEIELRQSIAELSEMIKRHELLGEFVVGQQPKTALPSTGVLGREETQNFITAAFREFNTELIPLDHTAGLRFSEPLSVWDAILLPQQEAWIDLVLEMSAATARHSFELALHRPPNDAGEHETYLVEAHTLIRKMIQTNLQRHGVATLAPYGHRLKRAEYAEHLHPSEAQIHYFTTSGGPLRVIIIRSLTPRIEKEARRVNTLEFLPQGFPHDSKPPLINAQSVVDKVIRHKINHLSQDSLTAQMALVVEPTATAKWYHREA